MSEAEIEAKIQEKDLTAPRITPRMIDDAVASVEFHVFSDGVLTVCCLTLKNGFTVTGESTCFSPENFDAVLGQEIALDNAREKIWVLEGYLVKQKLYESSITEELWNDRTHT